MTVVHLQLSIVCCCLASSELLADIPEQLLRLCQEIAGAVEYLSKKGFIHRDLAARNILLTTDIKCKVCAHALCPRYVCLCT